jgi:hypothetical protein
VFENHTTVLQIGICMVSMFESKMTVKKGYPKKKAMVASG